MTETIRVTWYTCDCPWTTKYCDEYHQASATVPLSVIRQYQSEKEGK